MSTLSSISRLCFNLVQGLSQSADELVTVLPVFMIVFFDGHVQDYLASLGIEDVGAVVVRRPNLLGLDVDQNLRKMIDYLQYVETPPDTIIKYLTESL